MNYLALLSNDSLILCCKYIGKNYINILCKYSDKKYAELILFIYSGKNIIKSFNLMSDRIYICDRIIYSFIIHYGCEDISWTGRPRSRRLCIYKYVCDRCNHFMFDVVPISMSIIRFGLFHNCKPNIIMSLNLFFP